MALFLTWLLLFLSVPYGFAHIEDRAESQHWPLHDDGLNKVVQWDHYSFILNGQRIFLFSGEFHYWRIPVPELWTDILQKIKAAGFTAFTFYVNWAYHAPNNQTLDFTTGAHDFSPLFQIAHDLGLYVFVRPGPYINAETNAGGFPLWLTTGAYGTLRNNDTRYTAVWTPYFSRVSQITSQYQITKGQNVIAYQIENEYGEQWIGDPSERDPNETAVHYMELLEANARANGIDVPLTANEPNMYSISWGSDWSNAGGNVDITGLDSYPSVSF
jgi:beta-galactosidase GanA